MSKNLTACCKSANNVGTNVRNDLQRPTTTYNDLQRSATTYNDLQRPTTIYNDPTTTYIATLQRFTTTSVERRDAWRS